MKIAKKIVLIFVGTLLMSIGAHFFNFPSKIAAGGVGGTALIVNTLIPSLEKASIIIVLNIVLFIIGVLALGKEFGVFTFVGVASYSLFLKVFEIIEPVPKLLVDDKLVNLIIGASLIGVGIALVFNQNASTGGSDVIVKILDRYTRLNISGSVIFTDSLVIIFASLVLGIESGIYSILSLTITTIIMDKIISGFNIKYSMTIISTEIEKINSFIHQDLNRGTTIYKALGGYTGGERNILVTIVDRTQYIKIRNYINKIDSNAFVFVSHTSEVIGEGFTRGVRDV